MTKLQEGDIFEGQIGFLPNGSAYFLREDGDIFIYKKNTLNALHLDKVKIEAFQLNNKFEGRVIGVISRFKTQYVGRVQINGDLTFVVPDSNKIVVDFFIKRGGKLQPDNDEKVVVEFVDWTGKSPLGVITKILGKSGDNNTEMNSIMAEYGLPVEFSKDVTQEALSIPEVLSEEEIALRKDYRHVTTFTIDPLTAKDFDDALSVTRNDRGIEVGVHIADVSHYVKKGTKLDDEAFKRATSVYLVDRCVPMLPERLSNGICSLKPNVDRPAFSAIFTLDANGNVLDEWFGKTVIHSDRRFTYEEAQEIIEGKEKLDKAIAQALVQRFGKEGYIEGLKKGRQEGLDEGSI